MRQWSLFALRNIMEGNLDCQNVVANIDSVGVIDPESSVKLPDTLWIVTADDSISNDVIRIYGENILFLLFMFCTMMLFLNIKDF